MITTKLESREYVSSQEPRGEPAKPRFPVPPGACDSHAHIFGPIDRYPLDPNRTFNPSRAGIEEYRKVLAALGMEHAVIVHSSAYGTDNSVTRDALIASNGAWRGVALVDPSITPMQLGELHAAGFRGVRFNFIFTDERDLDSLEVIARRIAVFDWHIQLLVDARELDIFAATLRRLPVPVVIDHMGRMPTSAGIRHPGFRTLLKLVQERKAWCKLSGANRMSDPQPPYPTVSAFARALVNVGADRLVWGTDWPHVREPGSMPDDGDLLNLLEDWVPDAATRNAILADNPGKLYGFN